MTKLAQLISALFHPLLGIFYTLILLLAINPYLFSIQEPKQKAIVVILIFLLSVIFPLLAIVLLRSVGLIKSLKMQDRSERVVPLIVVGIFYLWLYVNMKNNSMIPEAFAIFVLGANISLFLAFFINNFSKISLHAVGMGGILGIILLIKYYYSFDSFYVNGGGWGTYILDLNVLIVVVLIFAGLVGSARMWLSAHTTKDLYGGYFIGLASQFIAFRILFEN